MNKSIRSIFRIRHMPLYGYWLLGCLGVFITFAPFSSASDLFDRHSSLAWEYMLLQVLAGLALFLYGLELMIQGLLAIAGQKMKNVLSRLTKNWISGALSGTLTTAVIQSSSVTTVLVVGFVSAGLMSVNQAASVVMGANLGTTITAQILAFQLTYLAYLMIFTGFGMKFFSQTALFQNSGRFILGLGLLFLGMEMMGNGMAPLKTFAPFLHWMQGMENPFFGIVTGMIFTALIQSSSAAIGIVIVMASQGFLNLEAGIALSMGADIGTCITALLAAVGQTREAKRTAMIHVLFNVLGVLIWLPFIGLLAYLALEISPTVSASLSMIHSPAEDIPRAIANANTLFKLSALILFLPLIPLFVWAVYKLLPINESEKSLQKFESKYLDINLLPASNLAFEAIELELDRFRELFNPIYKKIMNFENDIHVQEQSQFKLNQLENYQHQILMYLGQISKANLDEAQQQRYIELISIVNILESILETLKNGLVNAKIQAINAKISPSPTMKELMGQLAAEVGHSIDKALNSTLKKNADLSMQVFASKATVDHLIQQSLTHQAKYLEANPNRLIIFRLEMQMVDAFKRLHTLSKRIARISSKNLETGSK